MNPRRLPLRLSFSPVFLDLQISNFTCSSLFFGLEFRDRRELRNFRELRALLYTLHFWCCDFFDFLRLGGERFAGDVGGFCYFVVGEGKGLLGSFCGWAAGFAGWATSSCHFGGCEGLLEWVVVVRKVLGGLMSGLEGSLGKGDDDLGRELCYELTRQPRWLGASLFQGGTAFVSCLELNWN